MRDTNIRITADTSQAASAIRSLSTTWTEVASKMSLVGSAFGLINKAIDAAHNAAMRASQYADMLPTVWHRAAVQSAISITKGQIEPMALARAQNQLLRGDVKLTEEQFGLLAKSAVALADATGGDAAAALDALSRALYTGSTRGLAEYGIRIDETGSKTERAAALIKNLQDKFGGYQVEITNYSDQVAAAAADAEMRVIAMGAASDRAMVRVLQNMDKFKDFIADVAGDVFDAPLSKRQQVQAALQEMEQGLLSLGNVRIQSMADAIRAEQQATIVRAELRNDDVQSAVKRASAQIDVVSAIDKERAVLEDVINKNKQVLSLVAVTGVAYDGVYARQKDIADAQERLRILEAERADAVGRYLDNYAVILSTLRDIGRTILDQVPILERWGMVAWTAIAAPTRAAHKHAQKSAEQLRREAEEARRRAAEAARQETLAVAQAEQDRARREAEDARFWADMDEQDRERQRKAAEERKRIRDAEMDYYLEQERKAADEALASAAQRTQAIRDQAQQVGQIVLQAAMAERKAMDGMTRSEYILRAIRDYMRGEAVKYAAKSIGYAAEAAAATWLNPPAAAGLWQASSMAAAAAAAFGAGALALRSMAGGSGKSSTKSGTSGQSSGAQTRPAGTTETRQRTEIHVHLGRGMVMGNPDDLARAIMQIVSDAQRRGTARW